MPQGVSGPLLLTNVTGAGLPAAAQVTLPNTGGYAPGAMLSLVAFNPLTGGHDVVGKLVVSADGETMTSLGEISLGSATPVSSPAMVQPAVSGGSGGSGGSYTFQLCWLVVTAGWTSTPDTTCAGCEPTVLSSTNPGNNSGTGTGVPTVLTDQASSDAGLVTGSYFLDHQLATYQSQGQENGIDLQYSSQQADPTPVVQYQFTTPPAGDSAAITSVTAQVSLAGVSQGPATTYNTPGGLQDGTTYNIPLQVNASSLATGVYSYTMTITENFGSGSSEVSLTSTDMGYVNIVDATSDPLGAGWSVGGLQKVSQLSSNGPVLITAGQQGTEQFDSVYSEGQTNLQDLGLATTTSSAKILANDGSGDFSGSATATDTVAGTASGDFNGDGKPDMAVVSSTTLTIQLNNGMGGFTAGNSYAIPSGYKAKAVAVGNFSGHAGGTLDIAVLMYSTSTNAYYLAEYTGNGAGGFASPVVSAAGNGVASGSGPDTMSAANFTGTSATGLVFNTDDGKADVMLPTSGGSFGEATALALPSGHTAIGVTTTGNYASGDTALVVEVKNANVEEGGIPFVALDAFTTNGSGTFTYTSTFQTSGQPDLGTVGLVTGVFQGSRLPASRSRCPSPTAMAPSPTSRSSHPFQRRRVGRRRDGTGRHLFAAIDPGGKHRHRQPERLRQAQHRAGRQHHGPDQDPGERPRQQPVLAAGDRAGRTRLTSRLA